MRNAIMQDIVNEYDAKDLIGGTDEAAAAATTDNDIGRDAVNDAPVTENETATIVESGATPADAVVDNAPMEQTMKARIAVFEAILDEVVEDGVTNPPPGENPLTQEEATEVAQDVTDKAIEYDVVPPSARACVASVIQRHFAQYDPQVKMLSKAARFVTAVMTEVDEDAISIDPVVDEALCNDADKAEDAINTNANEGDVEFDSNSEVSSGNQLRFRRRKSRKLYIPGFMSDDNDTFIEEVLPSFTNDGEDIGNHVDDGPLELEGENPTSEGGPSMRTRRSRTVLRRSSRGRYRMDDNDVEIEEVLPPFTNEGKDIGDHVDEGPLELEGENPTSEGGPSMRRRGIRRMTAEDGEDTSADDQGVKETVVSDEVKDEVVDPDYDVSSENVANTTAEAAMRFLAASVINQRKSTVMVSRAFTSALYRRMAHELRHVLPHRFVARYRIR